MSATQKDRQLQQRVGYFLLAVSSGSKCFLQEFIKKLLSYF